MSSSRTPLHACANLVRLVVATAFLFCFGSACHALAPLTGISKIAAGSFHTCVLTTTGGVKCWGSNSAGQSGQNPAVFFEVDTATDVPGLASGVIAIAAGGSHTCALTSTGGVKCWGLNQNGQLGDNGAPGIRFTPADVPGLTSGVTAISAGLLTTCAVAAGGAAKCWGANGVGQLGDNSTTERLVPTDVFGLSAGVSAISTYNGHSCVLISGGIKCWGQNNSGQLGNDPSVDSLVPVQVVTASMGGALGGMTSVSVMFASTCGRTAAGGAMCWGDNSANQLGNNVAVFKRYPVSVLSGPSLPALAGVDLLASNRNNSCVVMSNSGAKCWGQNTSGQLGVGDNNSFPIRSTPVDVVSGPALTPLTGVTATAVGETHACALMSDTGVKCWGANFSGLLGNNAVGSYQFTPVDVLVPSLALAAVQSRKTHGTVGDFDVLIDKAALISGLVSVEPRVIDAGHLFVFQFDGPVNTFASVAATDAAGTPVGSASATTIGNDVRVLLTGVIDNSRVKIALTGVNGNVDVSVAMGFLVGDVNNTRSVNSSDISAVKARSGQTTTALNFQFDVNASGAINSSDISAVKARSGLTLP